MLIGYARVSTTDQNPDLQTNALKEAGCERVFVEHASGGDRERPQLEKALNFCRNGDVFVAWKLDRIARSVLHLTEISARLKLNGIGLKVLTDPIDTTTPSGELMFHLLAAFAQFEKSIIHERTMAGLARARAQGRIGGRPRKVAA